jgi:hypothetical protein
MSQTEVVEYQEHPSFMELVPRVREYVGLKGMDWCIVALVDGSVGYYTYDRAKRLLEYVLKGRNWFSERTMACFEANAAKEALHDFKYFEYMERNDPEYVRRLIRVLKNTEGLNTIQSWTFSAMYPTTIL